MPGGRITLVPSRGSQLTMLLEEPPDRPMGVGGFEAIERALRRPAKYHKAIPDETMGLKLIIDIDAVGGPSVERRIRVLRDMGLPSATDDPPTITVEGDVWVEDQNVTWVIADNGISLGDRLWNPDGTLRRQHVSVALERFDGISEILPVRVRSTRSSRSSRRRRVVVAKANDTLRAISLRELGSATRWKDIQRWNKTKLRGVDPDARLRTGTHLTIR